MPICIRCKAITIKRAKITCDTEEWLRIQQLLIMHCNGIKCTERMLYIWKQI